VRSIKKNVHWVVLALLLIVCCMHAFIMHRILHFGWSLAFGDAVVSSLVLSLGLWGLILLIRKYPTTAAITFYALAVSLFISLLIAVTEYELLNFSIDTLDLTYKPWLKQTLAIRFLIIWIFNIWIATIAAMRKNMSAMDARFQQVTDASVLLKEAELFKLRQQMQPHFLYNSLNSINALIMISPDRAQQMIGKLSDFLRSSVRRESEDAVPISEELNYIQSYLAIESVRFGDRLKVRLDQDYTDDATMPPFLLQPILENAVKFGLYGKTGEVNISIHIALDGPILTITITNPYEPNTQPPKGTGFGLEGVQRRLFLLYARTDLLETHKQDDTFTTILKIPQHHVQSATDR
jgi:two-component system LytT family sensor kinase